MAYIITIRIFAALATIIRPHIAKNIHATFVMIAKGLTKLLNIKAMDINTILRNTLFHIKDTGVYYTINIHEPYKTDKGLIFYFINNSLTAYEYRVNLIKAVKGRNKALESITIIYKE